MTGSAVVGKTVKIGVALAFSGATLLASAGPSLSRQNMPALEFTGGSSRPIHVLLAWSDDATVSLRHEAVTRDAGEGPAMKATTMVPPNSTGMDSAGLRLLTSRTPRQQTNPKTSALRGLISGHRAELQAKIARR